MNHYQRLKDIREDADITQEELAKIFGTSPQQISKWERGVQEAKISKYILYAEYFNVSLDYLAGLTNVMSPYKK